MKIKDCMSNNVCCVKPETTITEIAKLMKDNHIGCVPVCDEENKIVGIVTDRDIVLRGIACCKDPKTTTLSDIMTTEVCCCETDADLEHAEEIMKQNKIRRLPVVHDSKVVGILTLGDLACSAEVDCDCLGETLEDICDDDEKNAE